MRPAINKITKLFTSFMPFICLAEIVFLQSQEYKKTLQQLDRTDYLAIEQKQKRSLSWQRESPDLGFSNLKANWSYLNFVQYFGDKYARETIGYQLVPDYFETISKIDPHFTTAYLNLSVANSMYTGNPEKTIALLEQILESVDPKSEQAAFLWTSKGLDELLFMGDKEAAINSYQMAAKWQNSTQNLDNLAIKDLAEALENINKIDLKSAQIRAWSSVLIHVKDHRQRREIVNKINDFKAEIVVLKKMAEANDHQ